VTLNLKTSNAARLHLNPVTLKWRRWLLHIRCTSASGFEIFEFENGTLLLGVSWLLVLRLLTKVLPVLQRFHFLFRERAEFTSVVMMAVNFNPILRTGMDTNNARKATGGSEIAGPFLRGFCVMRSTAS
jgi:hypothetical protein